MLIFVSLFFAAAFRLSAALDSMSKEGCSIFHPFNATSLHHNHGSLLAPPEFFISQYENHVMKVSRMVNTQGRLDDPKAYARELYFEALKQFLSGSIFKEKEISVKPALTSTKLSSTPLTRQLDDTVRAKGLDWSGFGFTMAGTARLQNIYDLLTDVFEHKIEGAVVETGVWRGGMSIYIRAVLRAFGEGHRISFVCDSFAGLPESTFTEEKGIQWNNVRYLEVSDKTVQHHFSMMGLSDPNVVFVKGFFSATMKPLANLYQGKFAVLRLDGDMYESTVDVLYQLYGRLSIGGYVIMDDWFGFESQTACRDFFAVHGIAPTIHAVDKNAAYWQKTEEVVIQDWRYAERKWKPVDVRSHLRL